MQVINVIYGHQGIFGIVYELCENYSSLTGALKRNAVPCGAWRKIVYRVF